MGKSMGGVWGSAEGSLTPELSPEGPARTGQGERERKTVTVGTGDSRNRAQGVGESERRN